MIAFMDLICKDAGRAFNVLTGLRRNNADLRGKFPVGEGIDRFVLYRRAGREGAKVISFPPVALRPYWPRHETAAAIWADVAQHVFHAVRAEGAFEAADAGFERFWRELLVAVFAGWPQRERFDHVEIFLGDSVFAAYVLFRGWHEHGFFHTRRCAKRVFVPVAQAFSGTQAQRFAGAGVSRGSALGRVAAISGGTRAETLRSRSSEFTLRELCASARERIEKAGDTGIGSATVILNSAVGARRTQSPSAGSGP